MEEHAKDASVESLDRRGRRSPPPKTIRSAASSFSKATFHLRSASVLDTLAPHAVHGCASYGESHAIPPYSQRRRRSPRPRPRRAPKSSSSSTTRRSRERSSTSTTAPSPSRPPDGQKVELPTAKIKTDHLQAAARARRVLDAGEDVRALQGRARQERHQQGHRLLRAHVPGHDGRRARSTSDEQRKKMQSEIAGTKLEIKSRRSPATAPP